MTLINRSALLPFAAGQLFELVNDVESYPQYMDGCVGAEVLRREADVIEARLDLARGGIRQSFCTRNTIAVSEQITLELLEGPFEYFGGRWDFRALDAKACKVSLNLEFTVNNGLLGAAAAKLFERVTGNLVDAVSQRATELYG